MASYFGDLIRDNERIKKTLMDIGCRVLKYVGRAGKNPNKAAQNLLEAARQAEKWEQRVAKLRNVTVNEKHFERMAVIASELRAAAKAAPRKAAMQRAFKAVEELEAVVENTKAR